MVIRCQLYSGVQQWQKYGRVVRKGGQHGLLIAVPANNKKVDENSDSDDPTFFLWESCF